MTSGQTDRQQSLPNEDNPEKYHPEPNQASSTDTNHATDATGAIDTDDATLAPGLDGVKSMNEDATREDEERGETTKVTRLVYDEYDSSNPRHAR